MPEITPGRRRRRTEQKRRDCVSCICTEASAANWKNRTVLLYPGRNLKGAQEAEKACLGKRPGDVFSCEIRGVQVTLAVKKVIRRKKVTVGPELFRILQLPGVSTEEDFARWYHEQHDEERRQKASYGIVSFWMQEMAKRSTFSIDEEEKKSWCRVRGEKMYISMLAAGYDMKKEERDGAPITEEEAIEEASSQQEQYFIPYLLYEYFSKKDGFTVSEEEYEKVLADEAKESGTVPGGSPQTVGYQHVPLCEIPGACVSASGGRGENLSGGVENGSDRSDKRKL